MKIEAPAFVKNALSAVSGALKSKTNSLKDKASDVIKSKEAVLRLMRSRKIFRAIYHKMNSMFHSERENKNTELSVYRPSASGENYEQEMDYLTHALFDTENNPRNSVSSIFDGRISTSSDMGQLEEEIDGLADIVIGRFHAQMRLQKLDSFKQYQEMLRRGL